MLLNSAAETAKEAADELRAARRAGRRALAQRAAAVPAAEFREALRGVKAVDDRRSRRLLRRGRRQPVARGARRAPGRSATTRRRCSRASTASAARTSTPPTRETFFERGARGGREAGASTSPSPTTAPRRASPATGPSPACRRSRPADVTRGMAQGDAATRRPGGSRSSSQPLWKMTAVPSRIAPGTWRLPGLRRLPDAAPDLQRPRGRRRRAVPDRLRDGRDHRLPVDGAPHQLHPQPVPERRGDALGARRDVPRARAARRAAAVEGHHLRDDLRRRRHGHRHGAGDRRGATATTA